MTMASRSPSPIGPIIVEGRFDDIDALAASALAWDQEYEQIGRGRFRGSLTQVVLDRLQLGRESWSTGVLQRGAAPAGTWVFALPLVADGTIHIRRRPAPPGELLAATSSDDVGFAATGRTDLMIVVLPTPLINRWLQQRRGLEKFDVNLPSPRWRVTDAQLRGRANSLNHLLEALVRGGNHYSAEHAAARVESTILDVILDIIPSAEVIEPLHNRARIARAVLRVLRENLNDPPTVTELCAAVDAKERTLHLSCMEAFGRPPATLLAELRLNAAHRELLHP
jgi:AraC family ethanolamine operon transcriptional activator